MKRVLLPILIAAAGFCAPAHAASSGWVRTEGGEIRLVALPAEKDGTIRAMLDIRLSPGWKTYWRDPGQSGIPPTIAVDAKAGAELMDIGFPAPKRFSDGVTTYTGYDGSVALPLTFRRTDRSKGGSLAVSAFLGVCRDICIPVQAELVADTRAETFANPLEEAAIAAAEARLPEPPGEDFAADGAEWTKDAKVLAVTFRAPAAADGSPPEVFASGPQGFQFGAGAAVRLAGDLYRADVPLVYRPKAADPATAALLLTVRSGTRTMETPLALR